MGGELSKQGIAQASNCTSQPSSQLFHMTKPKKTLCGMDVAIEAPSFRLTPKIKNEASPVEKRLCKCEKQCAEPTSRKRGSQILGPQTKNLELTRGKKRFELSFGSGGARVSSIYMDILEGCG